MKKIISLLALLIIASCATNGHKMLTDYLNNGIGALTYEDVVKKWRKPDKVTEEDSAIIAEWIREDYVDVGIVRPAFSSPTVYGEKKTLWFDRETKILKDYKIVTW